MSNAIPHPEEPSRLRIGSVLYERDPGKRRQIWEYPQNERDAIDHV